MKKLYWIWNENNELIQGFFTKEEAPENSQLVLEDENFLKPKRVGKKIIEGATEEEIQDSKKAEIKNKLEELNRQQFNEMQPYDWYFVRQIRTGKKVPKEIIELVNAIDEKYNKLKNNNE